jgi:hypothetical protein
MMCFFHWKRVPRRLQVALYRAWNDGAPKADYLDVREAAIAAAAGAPLPASPVTPDRPCT